MQHQRRSMSIHRSRTSQQRSTARDTIVDAGAILTILQVSICVVALVVTFTLQFVSVEQYEQAGKLYQAVMGRTDDQEATGEAVFVGAFGTPITKELLADYADEVISSLPRGGESPYIPANLFTGSVALSARPHYPTYGLLTSYYGSRSHPISGKFDYHTGLDIAAPLGSDVYAALPGTVSEVGYSNTYGNYIKLSHGNRLTTVYNHCSKILATEGAVIRQGERIALVGSTGVSTGSHLHFDMLVDGNYTDPLPVLLPERQAND